MESDFLYSGMYHYCILCRNRSNVLYWESKTLRSNTILFGRISTRIEIKTVSPGRNIGSKLLYDNNFGINNRDVTLCGEGYFEVSKNKNLPFQVVSDDIKVEVLGTKFNVKNYPEDPNIKVALLEGSVMLYDSLESTILKPNQIAQYDKQNKKTTLKTIAAENTSAWINGHLYFDEENMETIALALERAFDVNITIKDETLKKMIFYGDFIIESNNIDEIMNIMAATNKFNYHYKIRKNEIEIFQ